jgi:hypothetical protein
VDKEAWNQLREAYAEAWQHRASSGDADDEVLLPSLERFQVDLTWSAPGPGRDMLLDCWHASVEPHRLRRALVAKVPSLVRCVLRPEPTNRSGAKSPPATV